MSHIRLIKARRSSLEGIILLLVGAVLAGVGLFMRTRPNEYQAVARIKVHREVQFSGASDPIFSDPYFIPTEFEMIQSEVVLGKVIEKLDLVSEWGKKRSAGEKLEPVEAIGLLRRKMELGVVAKTELIEIRVSSDDPAQAARLANTITETFRDVRLRQNEQEKTSSRRITYHIEIVDLAATPALPIRPNRPLVAAVFLFGSMVTIFGIYLITQRGTE